MVIRVDSSSIDAREGGMPSVKFKLAFRVSIVSNTLSSIRGTSKDCGVLELKVSGNGPTKE